MAEKIIGSHAGKPVAAGEIVITNVDYCFTHDASGPLLIRQLRDAGLTIGAPNRSIVFIDHAVPSPRPELSNDQRTLRLFAEELGTGFHEAGSGICHQLMVEDYAAPGQLILGTDSHTCTEGGLAAFATGMGATDIAVAMALQKTWLRVPETIAVVASGWLRRGVFAKDLILHLIGLLGVEGATYKALEFMGGTVQHMVMAERFTLTNMAVEAGAKTGLVASDAITEAYLERMERGEQHRSLASDPDATFEQVIELDASTLRPMVALPHSPANVKSIDEVGEVKVDEVFIGSCTNARIEDLRIAAHILRRHPKHERVRLIVTPASRRVLREAITEGILPVLVEAGAQVTPPGCGVCFGALGGVPADDEVLFSSSNRNFPGRTGNPNARTYLGSPAMAAATAVTGVITDPTEFM